jgi:hypothetical protein
MVPGRSAWRGAAHGEHTVCTVELAALVQHVHPPIDVEVAHDTGCARSACCAATLRRLGGGERAW